MREENINIIFHKLGLIALRDKACIMKGVGGIQIVVIIVNCWSMGHEF